MERRRSDPGHKRHSTRDTESAPAAPQSTDTACTLTVAHHTQQNEVCTVTREYTRTCSQRTFKFRHLPGHQPCVVNAARAGRRGPKSTSVERRRSDPGHKRHSTRDTESAPAAPQSTDTACTHSLTHSRTPHPLYTLETRTAARSGRPGHRGPPGGGHGAAGGHPGKRTAVGSRRPQPQRAAGGHPAKRTAAGSLRPQLQRAFGGHPEKRTAAGSLRPQPQRAAGGHPGKRTAAGSRRPQPQRAAGGHPGKRTAAGSRRPQPQRAAGGHPGKRTAAGSRRPQPQRAAGGHPAKRTAGGSRRPQPQRTTGGHPGKRTAAGSRRLSPNGFYLPDRNPVRQSLIRE